MVATRNSAVVSLEGEGSGGNAGFVALTELEFEALVADDLLVAGTQYYLTDTGIVNLATGVNSFITLNAAPTQSDMMPYWVIEGEVYRVYERKQGLIAMPTKIDGIIVNDGIIVEVH
jgi:hypothetical protein